MNTPLSKLLERFPDAKNSGKEWKVRCPAHDDRTASLCISEGSEGRALLKCQAGCSTESILAAIGLTMRDLFPEVQKIDKPRAVPRYRQLLDEGYLMTKVYSYHDAAGKDLFQVVRFEHSDKPKQFLQKSGKKWTTSGINKVLYRLHLVLKALADGQTIYIAEGEKDVDTLESLGLVATCNAGGALDSTSSKKWLPGYTKTLAGANVIILRDNDDPGIRHQLSLARLLHGTAASIRLVDLPELPSKGDVTDWVNSGGTTDQLQSLANAARAWTPPTPEDLLQSAIDRYESTHEGQECWHRLLVELHACGFGRIQANAIRMQFQEKSWTPGDYAAEMEAFNKIFSDADNERLSESSAALPVILADCQELKKVTGQAWEAMEKGNIPPKYFRRGGLACRLEEDDDGTLRSRELTIDRMRHELARVANWVKLRETKSGDTIEVPAKPPVDVVRDVLASPVIPLPVLTRIVEVPVFAPDGSLETGPGYHAAGQVYHIPAAGLKIRDVAKSPTDSDIQQAKDIIFDLICDFPFIDDADRAHSVALLLLPFVRDMIDGPTPNHLIEAPCPGTGKGLLADCLLVPGCGRQVSITPQTQDEEETRKRLFTLLREGHPAILIDNVTRAIDSGTLAAALSAVVYRERVMGTMESIGIPVRCAWVTTANNPTMSTEIARRCIRIRIDPKVDRPWQREGWKHQDLRSWIWENRGESVWAALTLVQAWIAADMPAPTVRPLGTYERWTKVIGGILENAGIEGFLANLDQFYEQADIEGTKWRHFVDIWFRKFGTREVGTADLYPLAQQNEFFDLGNGNERSKKIKFGILLGRQRDRVFGDQRVVYVGKKQRAFYWALAPIRNLLTIAGEDLLPDKVYQIMCDNCGVPARVRKTEDGYEYRCPCGESGPVHIQKIAGESVGVA